VTTLENPHLRSPRKWVMRFNYFNRDNWGFSFDVTQFCVTLFLVWLCTLLSNYLH